MLVLFFRNCSGSKVLVQKTIFFAFVFFCSYGIEAAQEHEEDNICFEHVYVKMPEIIKTPRCYGIAQAMHFLHDSEKMVFQVGIISTTNEDLTRRLQAKISAMFIAMKSESDCAQLSDAKKVLVHLKQCERLQKKERAHNISYAQIQFFYDKDAKNVESEAPSVLMPHEAIEAVRDKKFSMQDFVLSSDSEQHTSAMPIIIVHKEACKKACEAYRSLQSHDVGSCI